MTISEVAPGVYQLAWTIGAKPIQLYLLKGDGLILVDTGLSDTPKNVVLPAIREIDARPTDVRLIVITHADADHIGGNAAARALFPQAQFLVHTADLEWSSDPAAIMVGRYDAFKEYGLRYDQAIFDMLSSWMGPASPLDVALVGGERIRLADNEWLDVHHMPGHTRGHLMLVHPTHRYAVAGDVCFGETQLDTEGNASAPPPYVTVDGYRATLDHLDALNLRTLLTCHYPTKSGKEISAFVQASRSWTERAEALCRDLIADTITTGPLTLTDAIDRADPILGRFGFPRDLQFALVSHLNVLVTEERAQRVHHDGHIAWSVAN